MSVRTRLVGSLDRSYTAWALTLLAVLLFVTGLLVVIGVVLIVALGIQPGVVLV